MKARYFFLFTTLSEDLLVSWPTFIQLVSWPSFEELARHCSRTVYTYRNHSIHVSRNHQQSFAGSDAAGTVKEDRKKTLN